MDGGRRSDEFLLTLVLLAAVKALLTRWLLLGFSDPLIAFALEVSLVVLVLCAVDVVPRRRSVVLDLGAYVFLVAVMYGNLLYGSYFNQIADPSMLQMAGQVGSVSDSVLALVQPIHLLFIVDIPILMVWAEDIAHYYPPQHGRSRFVTNVALVALVVVVGQVAMASRIPASTDSFEVARAKGLGAYQLASMLGDTPVGAIAAERDDASYDETGTPEAIMARRFEGVRRAEEGERIRGIEHGEYAGKNVFIIQVESFQALAYGATINGQEITPNINKMGRDSWVCTTAYSQTGAGNTSDAEFISNTSLLPLPGKAASVTYVGYRLPGLPRLLSDAGYRTFTLHANKARFWNRANLYPALGFDTYYDQTRIGREDPMWGGSSDEAFLAKSTEIIAEELSYGRPIYAQVVTMTSHAPYKSVPQERRPVQLPEEWRDSQVGQWVGALSYTDMAVGQFLDWLREEGLYEDSIVVLYGDHKAVESLDLEGADKQIVEELLGREYSIIDRQHVPLLIHLPGQQIGEVLESTAGQVDIMPTVADLLGIGLDEVPHLGRSLFVHSEPLIIMRSYYPGGSFLNERVAYLPGLQAENGAALDLYDGTALAPTAHERKDLARATELSRLSDEWITSLPERDDWDGKSYGWIPIAEQRPESGSE